MGKSKNDPLETTSEIAGVGSRNGSSRVRQRGTQGQAPKLIRSRPPARQPGAFPKVDPPATTSGKLKLQNYKIAKVPAAMPQR